MKAVLFTKYGSPDVLELQEVEIPVPLDGEVLIRIRATSVNDWDVGIITGKPLLNKWGQSKNTVLYFYSDPIYYTHALELSALSVR